jgi:hypothetical protein
MIAVAAAPACSGGLDAPVLEVSSDIEPLTELSISLIDGPGALVVDHPVSDGGADLDLPVRIAIDPSRRSGIVRALVWGRRDDIDVAFGAADVDLDAPDTVPVQLTAPGSDCDGDRVPDAEDRCVEVADPNQDDRDEDGVGDACVPGLACPSNLLDNGDFEDDLQGWDQDSNGALSREPGGFAGSYTARMCKIATGSAVSIDAEVERAVESLAPGRVFRLDAQVRTTTDPPQTLGLTVTEVDAAGTELPQQGLRDVPATSDWQLMTTRYTTTEVESALDLRVKSIDAVDGTCFDFDAVCLVELFEGCGQ